MAKNEKRARNATSVVDVAGQRHVALAKWPITTDQVADWAATWQTRSVDVT